MSKSSQLALVLEEQANELGLTLQEALEQGFTYKGYKLVSPTPDYPQNANICEIEHILDDLDDTIAYLKKQDTTARPYVLKLREVERLVKELK